MRKEEIYYDSRDGINKVHGIYWIPDGEIKGILQLVHGMAEYIDRYDDFATYMAEKGILVVGNDHIGHGKSVKSPEDKGYFCENDPVTVVVRDVHRLKKMTQEKYPGKKYVILGHSMGSLMLRNYIFRYGKGIDGAVIMGTASHAGIEVKSGILLLKLIALIKGWRYRSAFADKLVAGDSNKTVENPRTGWDWLSRNEEKVDQYIADENCGFLFTLNGEYTVAESVSRLENKKDLRNMPKNLPVLFVSGDKDPVGGLGKGVKRAYDQFINAGMKKTSIKLYEGARHELLNETDVCRAEVYSDMYDFVSNVINED